MQRRRFFGLLGGFAAGSAFWPSDGHKLRAANPSVALPQEASAEGFNHYTQDYDKFCATPENERVFYALRDGRIVAVKLDNESWKVAPRGRRQDTQLPVLGGSFNGVPVVSPIPNLAGEGPYQPTWDSLLQYECPEWYRDAKFGIWTCWSPQCVPEDGDWYARNMYTQGSRQNQFHVAHYGPPSRFGYKDLCPQWTLLNWEPSELMDLFVRAGARYFCVMVNHHDGFDAWNSKYNPWNAVNIGPRRDVVGIWAAEARKRNLRFGVTVHQARNWWWFQTSHGADSTGPFGGRPYDGCLTLADGRNQWWEGYDPQHLYGAKHPDDALPDVSYVKNFYDRTRDLLDQYNPELLYFDDTLLPLGWGGMNIGAYLYNHNLQTNGGKMQAILNVKQVPPNLAKAVVADIERGLAATIQPDPWQSETCIGNWHYESSLYEHPGEYGGYLQPSVVIHWLADTISKNGTFLLDVPGKPDGTIDDKERLILEQIGEWFKINSEAVYSTRPWTVFGEGPHISKPGSFQGTKSTSQLDAHDIRYTRNKANTVVYAIVLGWPDQALLLSSLGTAAASPPGKVAHVELLGSPESIRWQQTDAGLSIELPQQKPVLDHTVVFKLSLA